MPEEDKAKRAQEIDRAVREADERKRGKKDDANIDPGTERASGSSDGELLDKLLSKLGDCVTAMDAMSRRLDHMERDGDMRKDRHRDGDDASNSAFAEQPTEEERKRREELGQEPGEARPVVADADARRRHALADAQTRADTVAMSWGQRADPPLAGESLRAYRCRQLRRYQRYSPQYKASDLETITDAAVFDAVEQKIYADAVQAASSPDSVPAGMLRMVSRKMPGGHIENTFIGAPQAWMGRFAYGRSRFVTTINPKQKDA